MLDASRSSRRVIPPPTSTAPYAPPDHRSQESKAREHPRIDRTVPQTRSPQQPRPTIPLSRPAPPQSDAIGSPCKRRDVHGLHADVRTRKLDELRELTGANLSNHGNQRQPLTLHVVQQSKFARRRPDVTLVIRQNQDQHHRRNRLRRHNNRRRRLLPQLHHRMLASKFLRRRLKRRLWKSRTSTGKPALQRTQPAVRQDQRSPVCAASTPTSSATR